MRLASAALLFVSLATAPAFCQNVQTNVASASAAVTSLPTDAADPSINYVALKEDIAKQNKSMTDQLAVQRAILKKNQDLLKEAQRINAANLKMAEEQKKLAAESAELEKQRATLKAAQKPAEVAEVASKQ
jgi:septal ring factor EnvC (AmiA/AmiB activator)